MSLDRTAIAILAGGYGTRLWPLSTRRRPKQFVPLLPEGSVLQATYARVRRIVGQERILVVGNREHTDLYRDQLPELPDNNLILEPAALGTGPCLALTAAFQNREKRFETIVSVPVDHVVVNVDEWAATIEVAAAHALNRDELVSIASVPSKPDVKFGYLVVGDRIGGSDQHPICRVQQFVEKPDAKILADMLAEGTCLRNMGMVAFRPGTMLSELARHLPAVADPLRKAQDEGMDEASVEAAYASMPKASIDSALLQKTERLAAVASTIESIDTGDFATLGDVLHTDEHGNSTRGKTVTIDASGNTVIADGATVAVVGADDLVIVVNGDTILVCPKDSTQRIREAAE